MALASQLLRNSVARTLLAPYRTLSTTVFNSNSADKVTHTGQQFDVNDPRYVRFAVSGVEKQVNEQWSEKLIDAVPPIEVSSRIVACDGGGGALGHPKVFINLDQGVPKACIYCGQRYVFVAGANTEHH